MKNNSQAPDHEKNSPADDREGWLSRERALSFVLAAATAIGLYLCYLIALPFIPSITWALALAIAAYPLHDRIASRFGKPSLAAGLSVLIVALVVVAPGVFLVHHIADQLGRSAETVRTLTDPARWQETVESNQTLGVVVKRAGPYFDVRNVAEQAANFTASRATAFIGGIVWVFAQLFITFFTLFYLLRDKRRILKTIKSFMPLSQSETDRMFSRVGDTVYATIYGTFTVSLAQGALGGLMFWWLGIPGPVLWGSVMFLLSLIPFLGAPVVWIPAAIYLGATGDWGKALILAGWGVLVIGSIDNFLYPILVGDKVRMHPLPIFFSVLGGLALIGAAGLILGPLTVVVTGMLIEVWRQRTSGGGTVEEGVYE